MKLTILGNNGTCPVRNGACTSFLLEADERRILIDMGNGGVANLQHKLDLCEIDMIIIGHLHFDHMSDLFPFKYAIESRKGNGENIKMIELLIPEAARWMTDEITTNEVFNVVTIGDGTVYHIDNLRIEFKKVQHLIDSYALRIEDGEKVFVYSSDTGACPQLEEIAQDADLFLCEASFLECERRGRNYHLSARQAGEIALKSKVKRMLLTHFSKPERADDYCLEAKLVFNEVEASIILATYNI